MPLRISGPWLPVPNPCVVGPNGATHVMKNITVTITNCRVSIGVRYMVGSFYYFHLNIHYKSLNRKEHNNVSVIGMEA